MLKLKGCPRCAGDVYYDWDFDGWFEQCLQCGYIRYFQPAAKVEKQRHKTKLKGNTRAS